MDGSLGRPWHPGPRVVGRPLDPPGRQAPVIISIEDLRNAARRRLPRAPSCQHVCSLPTVGLDRDTRDGDRGEIEPVEIMACDRGSSGLTDRSARHHPAPSEA